MTFPMTVYAFGHTLLASLYLLTNDHSVSEVINITSAAFTFPWPTYWYPIWPGSAWLPKCVVFFQLRSDAKSNPWPPDLQANVQATSRAWLIIYCPAGWATHQHLPLRSNASLVVSHYLLSRCLSGPCTLPAVFQCLSCLVWLFIVPQFELSLYIFLCLPTPLLSCILYSTPSTSVFWPVGKHSDTLPLLVAISRSSF